MKRGAVICPRCRKKEVIVIDHILKCDHCFSTWMYNGYESEVAEKEKEKQKTA
ncbi:hypothetical protein M0R19_07970 [Candidatus Pacearchaeota archaeon]|nr:hypothetical protein [Candidatus Pacearchaeota archaeon]